MIAEWFSAIWSFLTAPLLDARWDDWSGFWLRQIFDDRYTVVLFFPFLPLLWLAPPRYLRSAIIATGIGFLTLAFGAPYAFFWLLNCGFFYWFAERFAVWVRADERRLAVELARTEHADVALARATPERWPYVAAIAVIVGCYLLTMLLKKIPIAAETNQWLFEHARWCFPYYLGPKATALDAAGLPTLLGTPDGRLFNLALWNPHNIGTAYLVWRMTHYLSEINKGTIEPARRTLVNFYAYLCYAPNLMQGPIEHFGPFQRQMDICHEQRRLSDIPIALARIGWGVAKSLMTTLYFNPLLRNEYGIGPGGDNRYFEAPETIGSYFLVYTGVFWVIFALYLEFSGYCDISAGIARLLGYRQVENFNWCWFSTSLRDFWRRWHISLSALLRDYVYIPLGGNRRHATLNLVATFVLCGVWHIPTGYMAAWGALMGLMLAVNQLWVNWMRRLDERQKGFFAAVRRAVRRAHPLGPIVSWLFTMHCFVFSLLVFFGQRGGPRVLWEIVRRPLAALIGAHVFEIPWSEIWSSH